MIYTKPIGQFFLCTIIVFSLIACGTQKRLQNATNMANNVNQTIAIKRTQLDSLSHKVKQQSISSEKDSTIANSIAETITELQQQLIKISENVSAITLLAQKKSNFNDKNYYRTTLKYVNVLDSFQTKSNLLNRIYQLLTEAIAAKAFQEFDMGIFFKSGAFKIPASAIEKISGPFQPAIDSLMALSNRFLDVKHTAYLVFVGYADATTINPESPLAAELKSFITPANAAPTSRQLNLMLSALRASELKRNIEAVIRQNTDKMSNYKQLHLSYTNYGRGEELPFKHITDYQENDDRRRVVVFYWSVLPILK